jgi:hypothetical protein
LLKQQVPKRSVLLSLRFSPGSGLVLTLKGGAYEKPLPSQKIPCVICSKPVDLGADLSADENGKAVRNEYVKRIATPRGGPSIAMMADSTLDFTFGSQPDGAISRPVIVNDL